MNNVKGKYIQLPDGVKKEIFKDNDGNEYFISVSKPFRCTKDILNDINAGKGDKYVISTTMGIPVESSVSLYYYLDRAVGESIKRKSIWNLDKAKFKYYITVVIDHKSYIIDDQLNIVYSFVDTISFDSYDIAEEAINKLYDIINNFALGYIEYMKLAKLNISTLKPSNLFMVLVKKSIKCDENGNYFVTKELPFDIKVSEKILFC